MKQEVTSAEADGLTGYVLLDLPVVPVGSVGLWFRGAPLSDRRPLAHRLPPVRGPSLSESAVRRRRLRGDVGFRPAAGQLLVVLVVHVQQLPWTYGDKEKGPAQVDVPLPPEVAILLNLKR